MPPRLPATNEQDISRATHTPHRLEHIGTLIRQKYPAVPNQSPPDEHSSVTVVGEATLITAATIAVLITTPTSIYLLARDHVVTGFVLFFTSFAIALAPQLLLSRIARQ